MSSWVIMCMKMLNKINNRRLPILSPKCILPKKQEAVSLLICTFLNDRFFSNSLVIQ